MVCSTQALSLCTPAPDRQFSFSGATTILWAAFIDTCISIHTHTNILQRLRYTLSSHFHPDLFASEKYQAYLRLSLWQLQLPRIGTQNRCLCCSSHQYNICICIKCVRRRTSTNTQDEGIKGKRNQRQSNKIFYHWLNPN